MNRANKLIHRILEVLNHVYSYSHESEYNNRLHTYKFKTEKNNKYVVQIAHFHHSGQEPEAHVTFTDSDGYEELNNQEKNSAHKVLGTVVSIVKHHVKNNAHSISNITFSGDKDHAPVYKMMAKKLSSNYVEKTHPKYTGFTVNKSDIK